MEETEIKFDLEVPFIKSNFAKITGKGIYLIYDHEGYLCYIGRASNLRTRLETHISDHSQFGEIKQFFLTVKIILIESEVRRIEFEEYLIKKYLPRFNVQLRNVDIVSSHEREIQKLNRYIDWLQRDNRKLKERMEYLENENRELSIKRTQFQCGYTMTDTWFSKASGGDIMGIDSVIVGFTNRLESDIFRRTFKKLCYDSRQLKKIIGVAEEYDPFKASEEVMS